jgi:hypothetical protein
MKATLRGGVLPACLGLLALPACSTHYPGAFHQGGAYEEHARDQHAAYDRGYHHGVKAGVKDWKRHRRFDPWRHSRYRHADSGYKSRYGPRGSYSRAYRVGFRAGYQWGYGQPGGRHTRDGHAVSRR